jgi:hypothetical protein
VPLNDSLTSFRLVAVADADVQKFGTGSASIRVTQDLQVLAGLPPLVREGDRFAAMLTVRNTTTREMKVRATLQGTANLPGSSAGEIARQPLAALPAQDVVVGAGQAKEVVFPIDVPADAVSITWEASADGTGAKDRIKVTQLVAAAVPVRVLQATIAQLDGAFALPIAVPADALPETGVKRGGLNVAVQPKLTGALPGMRRFFETYPFICLEQKTSKSVGLKDAALWAGRRQCAADLPRQRRPGELLPAARRRSAARQRSPHRLPDRGNARGRLRAAAGGARRDARRPDRVRRRPHRTQVLVAARRSRRAQDRGAGGAVAPRPGAAEDARLDQPRAEHLADGGGDRLAEHPAPRRRHPGSRASPRRSAADPARAPDLRRDDAAVQHRGERLLVVADGQRRRQRGTPDPRRGRRPGLEGRPAAHGRRQPGAAAQRRLADDDREPVGLARARQVLGEVRVDAGRRHDHRGALASGAPKGGWRRRQQRRARSPPGRGKPAARQRDSTGRRARRRSTSSRRDRASPG